MQLIAGRTAQEYNLRRATKGAFWEDRYHATAIEIDAHLHRCVVYIDLNMVRAGAVNHPGQWNENGFCEIQRPPKRYAIIDLRALSELCGFEDIEGFQTAHRQWIEEALARELSLRDVRWSEAIAVGSLAFIEKIKGELGSKRRLTDLPRGVDGFEWSPDSRRLVVSTASLGATREEDAKRRGKGPKREPGSPPESDYRYIDRLGYLFNGTGFIYDRVSTSGSSMPRAATPGA